MSVGFTKRSNRKFRHFHKLKTEIGESFMKKTPQSLFGSVNIGIYFL